MAGMSLVGQEVGSPTACHRANLLPDQALLGSHPPSLVATGGLILRL